MGSRRGHNKQTTPAFPFFLFFFGVRGEGVGGVSLAYRRTPAASQLDHTSDGFLRVQRSRGAVWWDVGRVALRAACCCSTAAVQRGKPRDNLRDRNPISRGDS